VDLAVCETVLSQDEVAHSEGVSQTHQAELFLEEMKPRVRAENLSTVAN